MNKKNKDRLLNLLKQYKLIISDERQNGRFEFVSGDLDKAYKDINDTMELVALLSDDDELFEARAGAADMLSSCGKAFMTLGKMKDQDDLIGVDMSELSYKFECSYNKVFNILRTLENDGLINVNEDFIKFTRRGNILFQEMSKLF